MLHAHFSNRFEQLLEALLDRMDSPGGSPFDREQIIVPSAAVHRRIELSAADRFGVCANVEFSYLAEWLWRQIGLFVPIAPVSPFKTPVLTWRVFQLLDDSKLVQDHPRLASYLKSADATMRYELATRIAALFDQYLTYRTDWLMAWQDRRHVMTVDAADEQHQSEQDERWQAALWRRIAADIGTGRQHPSVAFFDTVAANGRESERASGRESERASGRDQTAQGGRSQTAPGGERSAADEGEARATDIRAKLPATAHVFCLPATPPLYLNILRELGRSINVHLYVLNPSREYWFEIVDPKRLSYLKIAAAAQHHEVGNRLLASWGKQTRAHVDLLFDGGIDDDGGGAGGADIDDDFVASDNTSLLGRVQDAILDLIDPAPGSIAIDASDRSIEVHVCHSLTRQLEVLHDQLLAVLAGPNPPRPSDIVVLTPNLEDAAPLIEAVFGTAPRPRQIPFTITGRPSSTQNAAARALLAILAVATSRFHASAVFDLLQQPIVARRFAIDADDRDTIHRWIRQSGIRWGLDAGQRTALELPGVVHHTFDDGLDRLFMGYALPSAIALPLNGRLPAGGAEGSGALALGSFESFIDQLERLRNLLSQPRSADDWRQVLDGVIETFLQPIDDEVDDVREAANTIRELHHNMMLGGSGGAIASEVVLAALREALDDAARGGVPTGAVTFSSMASLRNLPFKHVCAIGLDDGVFPSAARPDEFDLMAVAPRRGDRQRRSDERNLFLDVVLAAREKLYLSYTGRSVRDNAPLPPSVVVAELIDYLAMASAATPVTPASIDAARKQLVVEHPLQPFSPSYFDPATDVRRRSFNDEYRAALSARFETSGRDAEAADVTGTLSVPGSSNPGFTPSPEDEEIAADAQGAFFPSPLPDAGPEFRAVTLQQLERFFRNPSAYLLKERLGVDLPETEQALADDEPFVAGWPDRTALAKRLLPRLLDRDAGIGGADSVDGVDSNDSVDIAELAHAGVEYPQGRLGDVELRTELTRLEEFAARVRNDTHEECLTPISETLEFDIDGEAWTLAGGFSDLRPSGLIRNHYDDVRPYEYLSGWLAHLFLNAIAPDGVAPRTRWHSRDGDYLLKPSPDARERLLDLMTLYRKGLHKPLHFYPKSSWTLVTENFKEAYDKWRTTPYRPFPAEDRRSPAYPIALRGVADPLDEDFIRSSTLVFRPLLDVIEDPRLK